MSGDDLFHSAKLWEESRNWIRAIDTYLEIRPEHYQVNYYIILSNKNIYI